MIGAEARGRRRLLFRQLAESAARLDELCRSGRAQELAPAWAFKRRKGRLRAQKQLVALFDPLARLRLVTDTYLGWLYLEPGAGAVQDDDPEDPGIRQECIAARALLVGLPPGKARAGSIVTCRWTVEFTQHAVGRLLERSPKADPVEAMMAAHDALMRVGTNVPTETFWSEFWVPSRGWGAFACRPLIGRIDDPPDTRIVYVRARTWFDSDMLTDQFVVSEAAPEDRFGRSLFLPGLLFPAEFSGAMKDRA